MTASVSAPPNAMPTQADIATSILEALAEVRAAPLLEVLGELAAAGGDLEIDSREAEAVIAILETRWGRTLAKVEDLEPERLPSVRSIGELIESRWSGEMPSSSEMES